MAAAEAAGPPADEDAAIEVWFVEGCDATYPIGAWLHMRYRSNVAGMARVWRYPDRELFVQDWMEPDQTHEIFGPVTGPPGRWWIFGELLASGATDTCHYTTTAAATIVPTPEMTATGTLAPSSTATTTGTSPTTTPSGTATPSEQPSPSDPPPTTRPSITSPPPAWPTADPVDRPQRACLPVVLRMRHQGSNPTAPLLRR